MDFALTEEQSDVRNLAQQIIGDQTDNDHLKEIDAGDLRFDEKLWADLAQAGLLGIAVDEEYGGMGFGFETLCLLIEEVGSKMAPIPVIPVLASAALPVQKYASEALKKELLQDVVQGSALITAALIEPGSDNPINPSMIASQSGTGLSLSGVKHCVPFAEQAKAILMAASLSGELVLVAVTPGQGVSYERQIATSGEPQYAVTLKDVKVEESHIIARGDEAQSALEWISQTTTAAIAVMAVGVTERMLRLTAEYTSEREQFGVPIATFQAVAQGAATSFIDVESLRLVTQQAVTLLDQGAEAEEAVTIAKIWCGDVAHRVSQSAQQFHGGIGVDRDYPLFRYCLWAKQLELTFGSSSQHLYKLGNDIAETFNQRFPSA